MSAGPSPRALAQGVGCPELSSMRPSSARYSFPRGQRDTGLFCKAEETPGPAAYVSDYTSALNQAAAVVGTAPRKMDLGRPDENRGGGDHPDNPAEPVPHSNDLRYPAAPCTVFGTEAKCADVRNPDLVRVNPECRYGMASPGLIYTPNERKSRPSSAPAYSIPRQQSQARRNSQTSSQISPQLYYAEEPALGYQRDSRRRTRPALSFNRASRFPPTKQAEGDMTAECKSVESSFGGRRQRRAPSATFGSSTREGSQRARTMRSAEDRHPAERMGPPRIPHPQVATQKEILRYNSAEPRKV